MPHALVIGLIAGLAVLEPDFGTVVLAAGLLIAMLYAGGVRVRDLGLLAVGALPVLAVVALHERYRIARILGFLNPDVDPLGVNFQLQQSFIAFGSGGLWGVGLGESRQKMFYLPEAHTDFIFSVVGEELGLMGALVVLALFTVVTVRGFRIALRHPDPFASLLAFGVTLSIALQARRKRRRSARLSPDQGARAPVSVVWWLGHDCGARPDRRPPRARARGGMSAPSPDGRRVVIAGGGTGGHLYPGLALADTLTARGYAVTFVGTAGGIEARVVPESGYALHLLPGRQLRGGGAGRAAMALGTAVSGTLRGLRLLGALQPVFVAGVGGYASVAVVLAARLRRIPTILLEQNVIPGAANRGLARVAQRVCVGFAESIGYFPAGRAVHTGNPVRADLLHRAVRAPGSERTRLGLLVFGGSAGARQVNRAVVEALRILGPTARTLDIVHQTGTSDVDEVRAGYAALELPARVEPFIADMGSAYAGADVVGGARRGDELRRDYGRRPARHPGAVSPRRGRSSAGQRRGSRARRGRRDDPRPRARRAVPRRCARRAGSRPRAACAHDGGGARVRHSGRRRARRERVRAPRARLRSRMSPSCLLKSATRFCNAVRAWASSLVWAGGAGGPGCRFTESRR